MQFGYCANGMMMTAVQLVVNNKRGTEMTVDTKQCALPRRPFMNSIDP